MKSYILFDMDGTLTDPAQGITACAAYALRSQGIEEQDIQRLKRFIGPPLLEGFQELYGLSLLQAEQAVEQFRKKYAQIGIENNIPYPGIAEMLQELRSSGLSLAVATSKPQPFAQEILHRLQLEQYFCCIGGATLDNTRTKKGQVIAHVLEQLGISPQQALMVGDRRHDAEGAREYGMDCVGVLYGYGSRQELEQAQVCALAEDTSALGRLLHELCS